MVNTTSQQKNSKVELEPNFSLKPTDIPTELPVAEQKAALDISVGGLEHPFDTVMKEFAKHRVAVPKNYETSLRRMYSLAEPSKELVILPTEIVIYEGNKDGLAYIRFYASLRGIMIDGEKTNIASTVYGQYDFPLFKQFSDTDLETQETKTWYERSGFQTVDYIPYDMERIKIIQEQWKKAIKSDLITKKKTQLKVKVIDSMNPSHRAYVIEPEDVGLMSYNGLVAKYCDQIYRKQ